MANRRFIDFPIASSVGDNDIILIWQSGLNKQTTKATFLSGLPENLDELNDVAISGLTNGQILRYDSVTGKWENTDQGNLDLNDLNDVSIVSPSNGQVLVYNSSTSKWENSSGGYVPYTGAVTTVNLGAQTIQAGSFVKAGGTAAQFLKANGSVDSTAYGTGSVTSVALTMPTAFTVGGSPITTAGTLAVTGAGTVGQYIRGDGSLADFPESSGGGSSVSYYLNGSVAQGTIGGVAYKELNKVPILGAGTDFTINADGYIASFITDAGDPNLLEIPAGNWNFETYFSASSGGGSPTFYVELYKVNSGGTATLIASNSTFPELIAFGTNIISYFSTLAVPTTALALTDRLAIRYYVTHSGRTITLHTEDNHLCQIITTFTTGLTALNGLTAQIQNFAVGTSGTDFAIASATATHTFNLPTASATNRGALSSADWTTFNAKENAITAGTTAQYFRGDKTFQTLNTAAVPELTNLYYTEARVNANTNVAANTAARHNAVTLGTANGLSLSTQVLSLGLASAGVTGALSGTDWSTFNSKQNALTNPVTGTGASGQVAYFTGTTAISSESNLFWDATNDRLGIGTNAPAETLSLAGSTSTTFGVSLTPSGWNNAKHRFTVPTSGNSSMLSFNWNGSVVDSALYAPSAIGIISGLLTFATAISAVSPTERMRITPAGRVLIGTTTESTFLLDVNGTARVSGAASFSSTLAVDGTITVGTTNNNLNAASGGLTWIGSNRLRYNSSTGLFSRASATEQASMIILGTDASIKFYTQPSTTQTGSYSLTPPMTILGNGNVGIGTASPEGTYTLTLAGDSTSKTGGITFRQTTTNTFYIGNPTVGNTTDFEFWNPRNGYIRFGTNNTERMLISSTGNVGIGITAPTTRLDIGNGTLTLPTLRGRTYTLTNVSSANPNFINGTGFNSIPVRVGDIIDLPFSQTRTVTAVTDTQLTVDSAWTTSFAGVNVEGRGGIVFQTNNLDRVTITGAGNLGIGTADPQSSLHIYTTNATAIIQNSSTSAVGNTSRLFFRSLLASGNTGFVAFIDGVLDSTTQNTGYLKFHTYNNGAADEKMRITSGGNVLIGTTTNGASKLRIVGLPTSAVGLSSGDVYNLAGTLMIA